MIRRHRMGMLNLGADIIDDFDTGYSSLSYLPQLPVDIRKIDRAFVTQLAPFPTQHSIVATIMAMSRVLGLEAIAEGIETPAQLQELQALGCLYGQGYWFSLPVTAAAATQLLQRPARLS